MTDIKYEIGGKVRISGKWYEIEDQGGRLSKCIRVQTSSESYLQSLSSVINFIEDYEPPKKDVVHGWLDNMPVFVGSVTARAVNETLSGEYGAPPIARTYNGEKASEFGLRDDSHVLWYDTDGNGDCWWECCEYCELNRGDRWMMQPPAPGEC